MYAISRYFNDLHASVVVLAFDDYAHVSSAKSITQANRSKKAAPFEFGLGALLETKVPSDYNDRLRNRNYKQKVTIQKLGS